MFMTILINIILIPTIFNFMFIENMQFAECFAMSLSILLFILAAININDGKMIKGLILTSIATLCYQGTIATVIVYTYVFSIVKNKKTKEIIENLFLAGVFCILAVSINLIQIRISGKILGMTNIRMGKVTNVPYMIAWVIRGISYMIVDTAEMLPRWLLLTYIIILCLTSAVTKKKCYIEIIGLWLISFLSAYCINFFTLAGINTPRLLFVIGALIGNIFIIMYVKTDMFEKYKIRFLPIYIIMIIYSMITLYSYVIQINEHTKIADNCKKECEQINTYIEKYEQESNTTVKYIAICYDSNPTYFYDFKKYTSLYLRPLAVEWADDSSINYYTHRKLEEIPMTRDVYKQYFEGKNWDMLNEEQFIFIGDTLYYCIY